MGSCRQVDTLCLYPEVMGPDEGAQDRVASVRWVQGGAGHGQGRGRPCLFSSQGKGMPDSAGTPQPIPSHVTGGKPGRSVWLPVGS